MNILIVEDDLTSRLMLLRMLENFGECQLAEDGHEALVLFERALEQGRPFDLICLDYLMPEKDGEEVLKEIRGIEESRNISHEDRVKVIMTTGLIDEDDAFTSLRGLCDAFLDKPVDRAKLRSILCDLGFLEGDDACR